MRLAPNQMHISSDEEHQHLQFDKTQHEGRSLARAPSSSTSHLPVHQDLPKPHCSEGNGSTVCRSRRARTAGRAFGWRTRRGGGEGGCTQRVFNSCMASACLADEWVTDACMMRHGLPHGNFVEITLCHSMFSVQRFVNLRHGRKEDEPLHLDNNAQIIGHVP